MRSWSVVAASLVLLGATAGCESEFTSRGPAAAGSTGAGGTGGAPGTGGDASGGSGGAPSGCDPAQTPAEHACVINEDYGVFVSSSKGGDDGNGSRGAPFKSLAHALEVAAERKLRVYACGETFSEAVEIPSGTELYGGLECSAEWRWSADVRTTIDGPANTIAVRLLAGSATTQIHDVEIRAANATVAGGSSVAVVVEGGNAVLERCHVEAGAGMDGVPGQSAPNAAAASGTAGKAGKPQSTTCGGSSSVSVGAPANPNPSCPASVGGKGGDPSAYAGLDAEPGQSGSPLLTENGGAAESPNGPVWTCAPTKFDPMGWQYGRGRQGEAGAPGEIGQGASGLGSISATGFVGAPGSTGGAGQVGQGGGGAGGRRTTICISGRNSVSNLRGASGASGGSGGCGGLPGAGGSAGGASIAIISLNAALTLQNSTLKSGDAGKGGDGGDGQPGGVGGPGGPAGSGEAPPCSGGDGGNGGDGGPGGGGRGGHSLGIAFIGAEPVTTNVEVSHGARGLGGKGGNNNATANGADGVEAKSQKFD